MDLHIKAYHLNLWLLSFYAFKSLHYSVTLLSRGWNSDLNVSIIDSHSNSHSYGIAKSIIIAVVKAKLFPKLQLQAKLKTKL